MRLAGGRALNDDIVDKFFSLMVDGVDGPCISDGVDQATQPATHSFPYLAGPNPSPPPLTPPSSCRPVAARYDELAARHPGAFAHRDPAAPLPASPKAK